MREAIDLKNRKVIDKTLDEILNFLKNTTENEPSDLLNELFHINGLDLGYRDRKIMFYKLLSDKYIGQLENRDKTNDYTGVYITLDGLLFTISGGYKKQTRNDRINRNFKRVQTGFLFVASIAGLVYTCIQIYKFFCCR